MSTQSSPVMGPSMSPDEERKMLVLELGKLKAENAVLERRDSDTVMALDLDAIIESPRNGEPTEIRELSGLRLPSSPAPPDSAPPPPPPPIEDLPRLPRGWREAQSSEGYIYYWHVRTRETTFERPQCSTRESRGLSILSRSSSISCRSNSVVSQPESRGRDSSCEEHAPLNLMSHQRRISSAESTGRRVSADI